MTHAPNDRFLWSSSRIAFSASVRNCTDLRLHHPHCSTENGWAFRFITAGIECLRQQKKKMQIRTLNESACSAQNSIKTMNRYKGSVGWFFKVSFWSLFFIPNSQRADLFTPSTLRSHAIGSDWLSKYPCAPATWTQNFSFAASKSKTKEKLCSSGPCKNGTTTTFYSDYIPL